MYLRVSGGEVELRVDRFTIDPQQIRRLERTLSILPQQHLSGLRYIRIRDRANYAGGSTNVARDPGAVTPGNRQYWVMLDIDSFDPRQRAINNRPDGLHYTLLHEMGHVVDWTTRAFRWIRQHDRSGYELLTRRHHAGVTTGQQEKFADTYADLFYYPQGNRLRDDCIRVILNSPAFTSLPSCVQLPNGWSR